MNKTWSAMALSSALLLAACGDDEGKEPSNPDGGRVDVDAGADAEVPKGPPAFLAATRIFSVDGTGTTTYMQVLDSIDEGTRLNLEQATEFAGPAELFSIESLGWFGVGDGESPVLTRYTVGDDNRLSVDKKLNLASYGLTEFFADKVYYISSSKLYYPDPDGKQLLIINPTQMKVEGVVALPQTAREGYTAVYSYDSVKRDDKLLFTVGWFDWKNDKILPETGLVVLDVASNEVVRFDVDTRCGGITSPVNLSSGEAYFASSALAAALYKLGSYTLAPCALRIGKEADAFDTEYLLKLTDLTSGALAGEPIRVDDDTIFLRVLDDSLVTIKPETASWEVTGAPAWKWVSWDVGQETAAPVALEASGSDVLSFRVDGRVFVAQSKADYSESTLIELSAQGGPKKAMSTPGFLSGLAKLR